MRSSKHFIFMILLISLALSAFAGDCDRAIELYNKGTKLKNYSEKIEIFKEALNYCDDPNILAKIHNNLADAYENLGRLDDAKNEYKEAIRNDKNLVTSYFSLGDIYSKKGDYEYAIEWYEMGLDLEYDELSEKNLEKARKKVPYYKSKKDIVAALDPTRALGVVPRIDFRIEFDYNSDRINPKSEAQLETISRALAEDLGEYNFDVIGHTCNVGSDSFNMNLSMRRAKSVVRFLKERYGISTSRFEVDGKGESQPVATNDCEENRAKNRRVEFINTGM